MAGENELTVDDLKAEIPAQDLETLTLGDDTVAVRALEGQGCRKGNGLERGREVQRGKRGRPRGRP